MADAKNPGQFGNRQDTAAQASKGGQQSGNTHQPDQGTQQSEEDMDMTEDLT